jgi:SAM-dependent methyltransferase
MDSSQRSEKVARHYGPERILERIGEALRAAGKDPERLSAEDLAPVDQFHTGGRPATLALAELAGIGSGAKVVDLGGGFGGPARTLAVERGCDVTVVDLSPEFCRAGEELTRMVGLSERVRFRIGDALATGLADASFDVAWTQHSTMNIPDKAGLYREARRLVRPGGTLAMHEVVAGPTQPIHFPVPWAAHPEISFLEAQSRLRALVTGAGFEEVAWRDLTAESLAFYRERAAAASGGAPPLGLHLILGDSFAAAFRNLIPNVEEQRIEVIQAVFRRP